MDSARAFEEKLSLLKLLMRTRCAPPSMPQPVKDSRSCSSSWLRALPSSRFRNRFLYGVKPARSNLR